MQEYDEKKTGSGGGEVFMHRDRCIFRGNIVSFKKDFVGVWVFGVQIFGHCTQRITLR